jgi:hypothetical protein
VAEHTVVEHELGAQHPDSVGIGSYRIDLHPRTGGEGYLDIDAPPFQIPLGALVPVRVENLLPGAKNLGTTHITNGCHRVHPVEWNVGEAAGSLAAFCGSGAVAHASCTRTPRCAMTSASAWPATESSSRGPPDDSGNPRTLAWCKERSTHDE